MSLQVYSLEAAVALCAACKQLVQAVAACLSQLVAWAWAVVSTCLWLRARTARRFFMAGSFTKQDYIDSMEGATLSGRMCAAKVLAAAPALARS